MSIPALSLGGHDRYTPDIRDRILEKLQAAPVDETVYQLLTPARLRALAEIKSTDEPVLSFYFQLGPERRVGRAWHTFFSSLCDATLKPIEDRHWRHAMQEEFDRIEQTLETELPTLGHGVAFFVCRKLSLWRQIAVSVALPDGVFVRPTPYLRPLARTRDEHDRFVLALLSQELSRFFISQIGQVEEAFQIKANQPRKVLMDGGPEDRPHVMATEPLMNEARLLAHAEELVLTQFEGRHLLRSGGLELARDRGSRRSRDHRAAGRSWSWAVCLGRAADPRRASRRAGDDTCRRRYVLQARGTLRQLRWPVGGMVAELSGLR